MLRRLIVLTALAGGMSIAAAMLLAAPALAKGPSQARITGPGLARAIVVSGEGEPGQPGRLASLAEQTSLFTVLFGMGGSGSPPARPVAAPPQASLGPRYTVVYTVPGVDPQPGAEFGRVRQDLYPDATGGPLIYTPPGQRGFGQALQAAGWLRCLCARSLRNAELGQRAGQLGTAAKPPSRLQGLPEAALTGRRVDERPACRVRVKVLAHPPELLARLW